MADSNFEISEDWLLANMPFVSFFCENDPLYSMRFLTGPGGEAFGYAMDDFVDNKSYFAASTIFPDDQDFVDTQAEQALAGGRPVVSRYRLVTSEGDPAPALLIFQAVVTKTGDTLGFAGTIVDLRAMPALHGPYGLLSSLHRPAVLRPSVEFPGKVSAAWLADELPMQTFVCENDESYSVRANRGSLEELLGYRREDFSRSGLLKPWSVLHPDDQEVADAYFEAASAKEGACSVARIRLVDRDSNPVSALVFARGVKPPGADRLMVSGGLLNVSHVKALDGPSMLLHPAQ